MSRGKSLSKEELNFIKVHLLDMSIQEIADALGRNYYTIYNFSKAAGIKRNHEFTPEEDEFIRRAYNRYSVEYIANKLNLTKSNIYNRARALGVSKKSRV